MRKLTDIVLEKANTDLKSKYEEYFKKKLKEFNAESPADLSDDKKTEFFNAISKGWKSGVGEVKEDYEDLKKANKVESHLSDEEEELEDEESDDSEEDESDDDIEESGKFRFKK